MHNCGVFPSEEVTLGCLITFFFFSHAVLFLTTDRSAEIIRWVLGITSSVSVPSAAT